MTTTWIMQAVAISLVAGLGLGFAIRFSLVARVQDRTRRVAPQLGDVSSARLVADPHPRRAPNV